MKWVTLLLLGLLAGSVHAQIKQTQTILDWNDVRFLENGDPIPKNEKIFYRIWIGATATSLAWRATVSKSQIPIKSLALKPGDRWIAIEAFSKERLGQQGPVKRLNPPRHPSIK